MYREVLRAHALAKEEASAEGSRPILFHLEAVRGAQLGSKGFVCFGYALRDL